MTPNPYLVRAFCDAHPLLAERAAIALLRRSVDRLPAGLWSEWFPDVRRPPVPMYSSGNPPQAIRDFIVANRDREDVCPLCWQQPYTSGAWWPEAGAARGNLRWHACCYVAWSVWTGTAKQLDLPRYLARRQGFVCVETGEPLKVVREATRVDAYGFAEFRRVETLAQVDVDHEEPLWRVRAQADRHAWPDVLRFWGVGNLRAVTKEGHRMKTSREAGERAAVRRAERAAAKAAAAVPA